MNAGFKTQIFFTIKMINVQKLFYITRPALRGYLLKALCIATNSNLSRIHLDIFHQPHSAPVIDPNVNELCKRL